MVQSRFFEAPSEMTVGEIVALTGAQTRPDTDLSRRIANVAPLDKAGPDDLSYVEGPKYLDHLKSTRAGACLMAERFEAAAPSGVIVLRSQDPHGDFTKVARQMFGNALRPASLYGGAGVASGAFVHPSARVDGATIDPGAIVGPHAEIGAGTVVGPGAVIGPQVRIGPVCSVGANSTITHATIGDRVIVHPGCHIGQDGFGYAPSAKGHVKVPQVGSVVVHNDVEIGAGTTIDRGGMRDTVIGEGTKIDNLVQIGHNVVIGRHCIIVAQSGLSGSVTLKDFAVLAARVGIYPHVTVHEGAQISARATVRRDVPAGETWGGLLNAKPLRQSMREMIAIERLPQTGMAVASPSISETSEAAASDAK